MPACVHVDKPYTVTRHKMPSGMVLCNCSVCSKSWEEEPVIVNTLGGLPQVFRAFIKKKGADNVVVHEVLSALDTTVHYSLRCKICNTQYAWTPNSTYPYGVDLDFVDNFCESHATCQLLNTPKKGQVIPFKPEIEMVPLIEEPTGRKFR